MNQTLCVIAHGWLDYVSLVIAIAAMAFIALTLFLRGNDYRRKLLMAPHPHIPVIRMTGFTLAGFSPVGCIGFWIVTGFWPSIFLAIFLFGISCVLFTSENMKPWWEMLTKGGAPTPGDPSLNRRATDQ